MDIYNELIEKCETFLKKDDSRGAKALVSEVYGAIAGYIPNAKHGLNKFRSRIITADGYTDKEARTDIRVLLGKIKAYQKERQDKLELAKLEAAGRGAHVEVVAKSESTVSVNISIDMVLSQSYEALEKSGLSDDDIERIKAAMADVATTKGKDAETTLEKVSRLLDFASKGAGAAQAILLFIQLFMKYLH